MRRKHIAYIAFVHYAASIFVFIKAFSLGMSRFDTGEAAGNLEKVLDFATAIMLFPVLPLVRRLPAETFPGLTGHIPILANSLLWATIIYYIVRLLKRKFGAGRLELSAAP